ATRGAEPAPIAWDTALDGAVDKFEQVIRDHGSDAVGFYVSGQLLTEDYYVFNKLAKGLIGTNNIDTNSRLCMSSAVAGYKQTLGADAPPACYDDLKHASCLFIVGSNAAWAHPILFRRIEDAKAANPELKIIVADPRRTDTVEIADLFLPIQPGTDVMLFNGMLHLMLWEGWTDNGYIAAHTSGFDALKTTVRECTPDKVAQICGISKEDLLAAARLFATSPATLSLYCQGLNQSSSGTAKNAALINLHLATGQIGKPGAGPFSLTGQPNAMGGREVGGLASTLAAHMDFTPENVARVGRFWAAPNMATKPGLKAVDLFRGVGEGRIKAIWIMATNPAVSMPDAGQVREALAACPFVVVSDVIADTDTSRFAHVRLPATAWGEKDGTVTNSERCVSRQRPIFAAPGEGRPDWWIVKEVGRRMGWRSAFAYDRPVDVWREHVRLSAYQNDGARRFRLDRATPGNADYETMQPFRWGDDAFADGVYPTPDGRARLVTVTQRLGERPLDRWPITLNTGRYRDQWHTMTRTGLAPRLARHREEPLVEVHPDDAARLDIADGALARVSTPRGESLYRVAVTDAQRSGELFVPIHWTDRTSSGGRTGLLPRPLVDP
ncbi:MAG TPA: nitrate reductase, partial [Duganella sp.]|nr:nitrate reductase [Duganella sp.]